MIATKNEIATTFKRMRKESGKKRLKHGCLDELIKSVKQKNNLPDDLTISKQSIRQRLKPSQNLVVVNSHPGHTSPLADIEQDVVNIMMQMARLRQCVTPTQAIQLINAVIKGTTAQKKLESWKEKFSFGSDGRIGQSYWTNFKKRHSDKICSKKGQKYELDRAAWSTFANFSQMYTQIYEQMVEAKVAVELPDPVWMNNDGVEVCEDDSTGCKVTHDLTHPEMCIVMDEVGGNISQKGDGNKGGERYITGKGMVPQLKSNSKDKHYTVLGLTAISGDPVMCVVIFTGTRENRLWETGIDAFAETEGRVSDADYFEKNSGKNKRFPGGPTCTCQGKEVPCLTRWSPSGSITSAILVDILSTLDHIGVFDRSNGKVPFLLLDSHGSRLRLDFLRYINDPKHLWVVCFGVPYGTGLWQVGDSSQQNGAHNMASGEFKAKLIRRKETMMMLITIEPHEIILIINYAWKKSFARCTSNKKSNR